MRLVVACYLGKEEISCQALTERLQQLSAYQLTGKEIHWHFEAGGGVLYGNPVLTEILFMNLIRNSFHACGENGDISVIINENQAFVTDNGIGMSPEFLKKIYDSYSRADGARVHKTEGTGLGMSIVKKLVDQMKGTVEINSRPGKGSVVRITLPVRIDEAQSRESEDTAWSMPDNIAGMRVLLVEDNKINCEIVEYILKDAGAEVVTANDGKAAVDAFEASAPGMFDCILMDLMMPVMSGYEAARVIRGLERPDAGTVPIIALSANAFEEDVALAKGAGMNEHLAKPVDVRRMLLVMNRLRGRQGRSTHDSQTTEMLKTVEMKTV